MANYNAIAAISETIINRLRASPQPEGLTDLEYRIFTSRDFISSPINNGLSLFVYRIFPNGSNRTPPGFQNADGSAAQRLLPIDIHFFITIWGGDPSLQHTLAGWMMRVMEDNALLNASVLNRVAPQTFRRDETVELGLAEFKTEDLLRIFEALIPNGYQLSIPYYARVVHLESNLQGDELGGEIQQRRLNMLNSLQVDFFGEEGGEQ